jgi:hypothetical protein
MHRAWGAYPETILTFPDAGIVVDLRRPVSALIRQRLAEHGLGKPFGVVTACNPLGARLDGPANRRLTTLLASRIAAGYAGTRPAQGGSPDGSHQEAGWAIPAPLDQVRRLAADFLQNAVFWYDGERFSIVPVHSSSEALPLPAPEPRSPA